MLIHLIVSIFLSRSTGINKTILTSFLVFAGGKINGILLSSADWMYDVKAKFN